MIDLSDLGLAPVESAATAVAAQVASNDNRDEHGLVPGSILARTLYMAYARQPVIIVDSPPGAGKSTLIVDVLDQLLRRSPFHIVVAAPTRRAAADLAGRLAAALGDGPSDPAVVLSVRKILRPDGVHSTPPKDRSRVVSVRTVASCTSSPPTCDLIVFDEAYQTTFSDIATAADDADQVIMVGDPGQIGPVITQDTSPWEARRDAPHRRAPEVFAQRADAVVLQMDATYRLGQATVEAISVLYGFGFTSKRPDRHLVDHDGCSLPELATVTVPPASSVADLAVLKRVAELAEAMVGRSLVTFDDDGNEMCTPLEQGDVAVVVSHNVQCSTIQAILRAKGCQGITVGTADRLQGGQWHAVVALDPLVGHATIAPHQVNPGRLCVMASRHMTHLTWVADGTEDTKLRAAVDETPEAKVGIAVRRYLRANETSVA